MPYNNGMHQTKRLGLKVPQGGPGVVNVRFAGDPDCSADMTERDAARSTSS